MATYVLVHGAWGGSWLWSPVARAIRSQGHEVYTPSLTGLGERVHLASPAITLDTHIADVANLLIYEDLRDVILVGHSYGGMVITGVAARMPELLRALVYVDAFLPKDGEALWDIADEAARTHYIDAQRDHPGLVDPFPGSERTPRPLSPHPLLTLTQPIQTLGRDLEVGRRTYIYATRGGPTIFTKFHDEVRTAPGWTVHQIDCGHVVMAEQPDALTALLLEEAE